MDKIGILRMRQWRRDQWEWFLRLGSSSGEPAVAVDLAVPLEVADAAGEEYHPHDG
jgi:hypothetical protein